MDGHGVAYIANSYNAFGNNGTHAWNSGGNPINVASNTWPGNATNGLSRNAAVLDAMAGVLDHLPVVADYTIPAKMTASLGSVPAQVIVGASLTAAPSSGSRSGSAAVWETTAIRRPSRTSAVIARLGAATGSATGRPVAST